MVVQVFRRTSWCAALLMLCLGTACADDLFGDDPVDAVAAEEEPAVIEDGFDDANDAADGLVLDELPALEEEEEEEEWEGRNFVEDEEEADVVIAAPMGFIAANGADAPVEVDEDDPFAEILKKQPQFAAHVQQIRNGVEATLGGDLSFAARVVEATDEERAQMRKAAKPAARSIMEQVAKAMRAQFGLGAFMNARGAKSEREQRKAMVEEVLTAVYWTKKDDGEEKPAKIAKWEEALKARDAYSFNANARVFVAALSDRLFLDSEQRDALTKSIADVWKDEWAAYINIMVHNPEYFPNIKSKAIKPHLSEEQYQIWKGMPKTQMGVSPWQNQGNNMFNNGQAQKNPWFHDEGDDKNANANANGVRIFAGRAARVQAAVMAVARPARVKVIEEDAVSLHNLGVLSMNSGSAIIKQAIDDGAEVDEKTAGGLTPLHVAAVNGATKNVKLLLKMGADPKMKNNARETPAELAKKHGEDEIAKLLTDAVENVADDKKNKEEKS